MTKIEEMEYIGADRYNRIADVAIKQGCSVRDVIRVLVDVHIGVNEVPIENVWGDDKKEDKA